MSDTGPSGTPLPEYDKPPVVEVVLATALHPLGLSVVDLARFGSERLGGQFPIRQDQPPIQMAIESFDGAVQNLAPTLAILTGAPPIRLWFQSQDRTQLVQLQRDWMACNWQGGSSDRAYPRYEVIEALFLRTWDSLAEFLGGLGSEQLSARQCELSYINHIVPDGLWQRPGQLGKVIRLAGDSGSFLPESEDGQIVSRYRIAHGGSDVGRLYVQAAAGLQQADRSPVIQLTMTARGMPLGEGRDGVLGFFRLAHQWIVSGFAAVTTDEAQRTLWERTQ